MSICKGHSNDSFTLNDPFLNPFGPVRPQRGILTVYSGRSSVNIHILPSFNFKTHDSTCQTQTDVPVRTRVEVFARASQTSEIEKYSKKTGTKILVHEMDTQTRSNRNMNENTQTVAVKSDSIGIQTDSGIESAGSDNEGKDQSSIQE